MKRELRLRLAEKGLGVRLPELDCFESAFKNYRITLHVPEYTSLCPMTGLPDFGVITLRYVPRRLCVELKSFKYYIHAYRNLGISYENAVNRILADFVKAARPRWAGIRGEFTPRGGIRSTVEAEYGRQPKGI